MQPLDAFPTRSYAGLAADDLGGSDQRPPLVLLHGLTFDRRMWRPALAELEEMDPGRRAIALDLPGHGDSPDQSNYSVPALVANVHAAVVEAGLEAPVIVGHSAAAGTAAGYAAQYPTRGVIAVEGTMRIAAFAAMAQSLEPALRGPGFDDVWARIAVNAFRVDEVESSVRDFVVRTSRPRQDVVLGYWQGLFDMTPAELDGWVVRGSASITRRGVPFVLVGGQDPSPEDVAWLRTNLPDARTEVWPGSGHFPHLAHPRRFAELLAETRSWGRQRVGAPVPMPSG